MIAFVAPSVVAAAIAAVIAGLVEGALYVDGPVRIGAAAGFAALYTLPVGALAAVVARALWRAWAPGALADAHTEPGGGAPRIAAWMIYVGVAVAVLAGATFNATKILLAVTRSPDVIALGSAMIVAGVAAALAACSRPAVGSLTRRLRSLDLAVAAPRGTTLLRPRALLVGFGVAVAGYLYLAWRISVRPRIGHLDLGVFTYAAVYVAAAVAAHVAWWLAGSARRARAVAAVSALVGAGAVIAAAAVARYQRPFAMLEVWAEVPVGGLAIDLSYDLERIRRDLPLGEIAPPIEPGAKHPDIILITVDTFRADRAPMYGGPAKMPGLARLAKEATVFEWAFSPGNVTRRSVPTIATGVSPERMQGRVAGWALRLDPRHVLLAERLRAAGYDTAGFFCCASHFSPRHRLGTDRGIEHMVIDKDGAELVRSAHAWLQEREAAGNRTAAFVWIHLIEPHGWEKAYPVADHGRKTKARYDMSLADVDVALAPLLDWARAAERRAQTAVIVTSDHGEGLGDHGHRTHATSLFNSEIHVPLIVFGPGIHARRIEAPVGLVDLAPTILELAGFQPPGMPGMDGSSLLPILRGEGEPKLEDGRAYAVMMEDRSVAEGARALIAGRYKLLVRPGKPPLLYDYVADRGERKNIAGANQGVVDQLLAELEALAARHAIPPF